MQLRSFQVDKCLSSPLRVKDRSHDNPPPAQAKWKISLCLVLLTLVLLLLTGTVMGAIQFIRWRGIW